MSDSDNQTVADLDFAGRGGDLARAIAAQAVRDVAGAIYTDGHSLTLTVGQRDALSVAGMIRPHPGRGRDGITYDDFILAPGITWDDIAAVLRSKVAS